MVSADSVAAELISATGIVGGTIGYFYRRFRKKGENEIQPFLRYVADGVRYYLGRFLRRQLAAEFALRQYARINLRVAARYMVVPAMLPVQLDVDRVYVPLLLKAASQETIDHASLLDRRGLRVIVIGDPGSGKSSLTKRLFRDACRRAAAAPRRSALPVLIELKTLATTSGDPIILLDAVKETVARTAVFRSKEAVASLSQGAGILVLLDGLDEVPTDRAIEMQSAVLRLSDELSAQSPKSSVVVTTRTQHYLTLVARDLAEAFTALAIQPLSLTDIYLFLSRWPYGPEEHPSTEAIRIFSRIQQLASLAEMCNNPLALAMYVARDQQTSGSELPETRTAFYSALMGELLVNRRMRAEGSTAGRNRLRERRARMLGKVCLDHLLDFEEPANSIPVRTFRTIFSIELATDDTDAIDAEIEELSVQTGLFTYERESETLRFIHLTLCEFLAATELVNAGESGWHEFLSSAEIAVENGARIDSAATNPRLGEVIAFAAGLAPRALRNQMLRDLITRSDTVILIRVAIETQGYDDPGLANVIRSECAFLAGVGSAARDSAWFLRLRTLVAALRDATVTGGVMRGAVQELPAVPEFLSHLISSEAADIGILRTLARIDPGSAILFANTSLENRAKDLISEAADDLAVLISMIAHGCVAEPAWRLALLRSALLHRRVALAISRVGRLDESNSLSDLPNHGAWSRMWLLRGSLYAQLLDAAVLDLQDFDRAKMDKAQVVATVVALNPPRRRFAATALSSLAAVPAQLHSRSPERSVLLRKEGETITFTISGATISLTEKDLRGVKVSDVKLPDVKVTYVNPGKSKLPDFRLAHLPNIESLDFETRVTSTNLTRSRLYEELLNLRVYPLMPVRRESEDRARRSVGMELVGVRREEVRALKVLRDIRGKEWRTIVKFPHHGGRSSGDRV